MRAVFLAAALTSLAFLPSAAGQDPDGAPGCVEANPCDLILAVDADGFADVSETEFTAGDWLVATIYNDDEAEHTVTLASHSLTVTIDGGDLVDSEPFRIGSPGSYALTDAPSGDTVQFTSVEEDEFEGGDGGSGGDDEDGNGTPAPSALLALAAIAVAAFALRRKA